jgi:hypothetical protein
MNFPPPDATREEVAAFFAKHAPMQVHPDNAGPYGAVVDPRTGREIPHEAPVVDGGPSLVCNACGLVRVGLGSPFCSGCRAQLSAAGAP